MQRELPGGVKADTADKRNSPWSFCAEYDLSTDVLTLALKEDRAIGPELSWQIFCKQSGTAILFVSVDERLFLYKGEINGLY